MNDARNKLRSMGGIMASSPQLMQAATQRFNNGGLAMTTAPMGPPLPAVQYNDVMRSQMEPPVVGLGRVAPPPVRPAGLPESPVFRGGRGPVLGAADEEDIVAELMAQSSVAADEPFVDPTQAMQSRWDEAISGYPQKEPSGFVTFVRETVTPKREAKRRRETAKAQREEDTESREANLPGTTVLEAPVDLGGLVPKRAQEDPAEAEKIAQDAMSVLLKTQQPTGDGGGDGEEDPAKSLEDSYKDARALISKVYGEEDDGVDNRMMDLAMIGLAIAAGQSPNALSNIAQGLLVGTQGMAQRREAERERERGLRTLALETAIAQQGAATEAEREAARMDLEQQNRLELEREKARLGAYSKSSGFPAAISPAKQALDEETKIREEIAAGRSIPDQYKDNPEAFIINERNKKMLGYIEGLGTEGQITDPRQMYMYRDVDPADPEAGQFPVVRSERELGFILPEQSYLRYNPSTGGYTRETKPASE